VRRSQTSDPDVSRGLPPDEGRLLQLVYYAYVVGSAAARLLPERIAYRLAHALGSWQARSPSPTRAIVQRNLARITGEPSDSPRVQRLVVDAYRSYARYWLETFRLVREGREFFLERFHAAGDDNLNGVLARGKGAVVAVAHLGNWDAAGAWVGATGRSLVTVAEVLKPRRMFDFFVRHRSRLGMTIHAAEKGVTDKLVRAVNEGAVVAILGDRDLRGSGPVVDFFGEKATLPAGPASVALRAGVPLLVAGVFSAELEGGRRGWLCHIGAPIELPDASAGDPVRELTLAMAGELERLIARRPEEWHVFQPFWLADKTSGGDGARRP
jgi:KDO2-lipid IV(A) lauroyltransferase